MTQRQPRLYDPGYLAFLRKKPCCLCGAAPTEAAHIRMACQAIGKPSTGMQEKPSDQYAVPLCSAHHRTGAGGVLAQHRMNEEVFWRVNSTDPFELAARYYDEYGGTGGKPRKPRALKPRPPKEKRQKIPARKDPWPKGRTFANSTRKS